MSRVRIARADRIVCGHSEETCRITIAGDCHDKDQRWGEGVRDYRSERDGGQSVKR